MLELNSQDAFLRTKNLRTACAQGRAGIIAS